MYGLDSGCRILDMQHRTAIPKEGLRETRGNVVDLSGERVNAPRKAYAAGDLQAAGGHQATVTSVALAKALGCLIWKSMKSCVTMRTIPFSSSL